MHAAAGNGVGAAGGAAKALKLPRPPQLAWGADPVEAMRGGPGARGGAVGHLADVEYLWQPRRPDEDGVRLPPIR